MKEPYELLPDIPIVPLDIAYEVVARVLQSCEQARRDFLVHGREGRLRWWKFLNSWVNPEEPVATDFLKRCELIEIQEADGNKVPYLAVRGEVTPPCTTIEVNGEVLRVLDNDVFGLSRDDLFKLYPVLAQSRSQPKRTDDADFNNLTARVQRAVLALDALEDKGQVLIGITKDRLAELVSTPEAPIRKTTLRKAETYRREHQR